MRDNSQYEELDQRIVEVMEGHAGQECVFPLCDAISDVLRQHHDPLAEIPLHERMRLREEEESLKRKAAEHERQEREKLEQEAKLREERERIERYKEKRAAAERVKHGGRLEFLPEEEEILLPEAAASGWPTPAKAPKAPKAPRAAAKGSPKSMAPSPAPALPSPRLDAADEKEKGGRYATDFEEIRFIGKGGFGAVTKVRHRVDRNLYAIKRIELAGAGSDRERILQECVTLPQLTHMNIVRYYQAWIEVEQVQQPAPAAKEGRKPGRKRAVQAVKNVAQAVRNGQPDGDDWLSHRGGGACGGACGAAGCACQEGGICGTSTLTREFLYIQMEYCDGTTLREVINSGKLQEDEALVWKLFRQILDALAYIHGKGLIHRDLKPVNIFLSREDGGHTKLGDFGLTTYAVGAPGSPKRGPAPAPGQGPGPAEAQAHDAISTGVGAALGRSTGGERATRVSRSFPSSATNTSSQSCKQF